MTQPARHMLGAVARAQAPAPTAQAPVYPLAARYRGRLIAVEGIDGSGKSTQLHLLHRWLESTGLPVHLTAWNSSSVVHEATRRAKRNRALLPATFSLMHAADLADRLEREIVPRLRAGYIVLADRWAATAFARDAARGCDPEWLRRLYAFAPRPNLAVYFRVPPDVAVARILAGRPALRHYEAGLDLGLSPDPVESFRLFQHRVAERYEELVVSERLRTIDAQGPVAVQQEAFRRLARRALPRLQPLAGEEGAREASAGVDASNGEWED